MEVILKKSKITSSIIKQAQIKTPQNLNTFQVLGRCICEKRKYIVFYENTGLVFKFPLFESVKPFSQSQQEIGASISFGGKYIEYNYKLSDISELNQFMSDILEVKKQAIEKGQFFI